LATFMISHFFTKPSHASIVSSLAPMHFCTAEPSSLSASGHFAGSAVESIPFTSVAHFASLA